MQSCTCMILVFLAHTGHRIFTGIRSGLWLKIGNNLTYHNCWNYHFWYKILHFHRAYYLFHSTAFSITGQQHRNPQNKAWLKEKRVGETKFNFHLKMWERTRVKESDWLSGKWWPLKKGAYTCCQASASCSASLLLLIRVPCLDTLLFLLLPSAVREYAWKNTWGSRTGRCCSS